jgi:hypothetical protein
MPSESVTREPDEGESENEFDSLEEAAKDVMTAIYSKDAKALATAFRAAFDLCDETYTEGEE